MTRIALFLALVMALAFVHDAVAQNPTMSLIPLVDDVRRECVGGPNEGQACTTTADCEVGPECQRVCVFGSNEGMPCTSTVDCFGENCLQRCYCNYVIQAVPGDTITTEVFASNWSPNDERLRAWQAAVDMTSTSSAVLPVGWGRPIPDIDCSTDEECPEEFPICGNSRHTCNGECQREPCGQSRCLGLDHCIHDGYFVDISRTDYVFFGLGPSGGSLDASTLCYRLGAHASVATLFTEPKYFATLLLKVLPSIGESAVLLMDTQTESCGLSSGLLSQAGALIGPLDTEGLTIEIVEPPQSSDAIPTTSTWGIVVLTLLLATGAKVCFGRKTAAV